MRSRNENPGREVIEREAVTQIELQTQKGIILTDKLARTLAILENCQVLSGWKHWLCFPPSAENGYGSDGWGGSGEIIYRC